MAMVKLAIDFDSAYTNIFMKGSGLVLSEPTVAIVDVENKNEVKYVGNDARKLIGKTAKNSKVVFPVFEGEIVNQPVAESMLNTYLSKIGLKNNIFGCQTVFSVPCGATFEMLDKYKKLAKSCILQYNNKTDINY